MNDDRSKDKVVPIVVCSSARLAIGALLQVDYRMTLAASCIRYVLVYWIMFSHVKFRPTCRSQNDAAAVYIKGYGLNLCHFAGGDISTVDCRVST